MDFIKKTFTTPARQTAAESTEAANVEAANAAITPSTGSEGSQKGAKFCWCCCCDYRHATIYLSSLGMLGAAGLIINPIFDYGQLYWPYVGITMVYILVMAVQIYGAFTFHIHTLCACGASQIFLMALRIWVFYAIAESETYVAVNWVANLFVTAFWIYPLVGMIIEIKHGIMSPENSLTAFCCADLLPRVPSMFRSTS